MLKPRAESEFFFRRLRVKITLFAMLTTFGCALIVMRLWHLQVMQYTTLSTKSESNRIREFTLEGLRGKIQERNGVTLVDNRPAFYLSAVLEDMEDTEKEIRFLASMMDIDAKASLAGIRSVKPFQSFTLKRDLSRNEVAFIEEHRIDLPGVFLEIRPVRSYVYGELASHFLGYLGAISETQLLRPEFSMFSRSDFIGQSGVEKTYENALRGAKGLKRVEVDAAGREISHMGDIPPKTGGDLRLTLDFDAQMAAERAFEGKMGAAIALDPQTGDTLVFVSKPSFNPNSFAYGINAAEWKRLMEGEFHSLQNRPIQGQYPPGSTYKVLMAAAALQEGVITPATTFFCPGHFTFGNKTYRCWKKEGHGSMNVHTALVQSCDVFFYNVGLKLGINKTAAYVKGFGLGEKSGLDPVMEKPGLIPTTGWKERTRNEKWILGETVSCAIGQGYVLVTPLQMARMIAAVANGGKLVTPRIVRDEATRAGEKIRMAPVSPQNLEIVRNALHGVVYEPHGTAASALRNGPFDYAGKTGTAQVLKMKQGDYTKSQNLEFKYRDHAWFVAFAPFDNPQIAVAVIAEHAGHGGEAAAPIARAIIDAYLSKIMAAKRTEPAAKEEPKG
jgi:penicillin-binding protein 2